MLHWSQDASTGWTRNSWRGSIAKVEDVPFAAVRSWESASAGVRSPPPPVASIYHPPLGAVVRKEPPRRTATRGAELTFVRCAATLRRGDRTAGDAAEEDSG